jgi:hypothetical protein
MSITVHTYTAPSHWACYLINGDCSGMDDADIAACDGWADTLPGHVVGCTEESDEGHAGFMRWHDAAAFAPYADDCAVYTVLEHTA